MEEEEEEDLGLLDLGTVEMEESYPVTGAKWFKMTPEADHDNNERWTQREKRTGARRPLCVLWRRTRRRLRHIRAQRGRVIVG